MNSYHLTIEELEHEKVDLTHNIGRLESALLQNNNTIDSLKGDLQYYQERLDDSARTVSERENQIEKLLTSHQEQIEEFKTAHLELNAQIESLQRDREALRQQKDNLSDALDKLQEELSSANRNYEDLEAKIKLSEQITVGGLDHRQVGNTINVIHLYNRI